jgi:hypothetical protein
MAKRRESAAATLAPPKPPRSAASMQDVFERKIRESLVAYRELVVRGASGEQLSDADMGEAADLLDRLGLPPYAWARDVAAKQADHAAAEQEARHRAGEPERQARSEELSAKVKAMEADLNRMRLELRTLAVTEPMRLAGIMQQRNELKANHPHVLCDVEQGVEFRLQAKRKAMPTPMPPARAHDGWSQ